jgi:hypothetical protein
LAPVELFTGFYSESPPHGTALIYLKMHVPNIFTGHFNVSVDTENAHAWLTISQAGNDYPYTVAPWQQIGEFKFPTGLQLLLGIYLVLGVQHYLPQVARR